jgi:hypothetical protein
MLHAFCSQRTSLRLNTPRVKEMHRDGNIDVIENVVLQIYVQNVYWVIDVIRRRSHEVTS